MNFRKIALLLLPILVLICNHQNAKGQYIIHMTEYEISVNFDLVPEDKPLESIEDEADFFLNLKLEKLMEAAESAGSEVQVMKSIIYIDGLKFAFEGNSGEEKISMISNDENSDMFMVLWDQKKVIVVGPEEIDNMQQKADDYAQEMIKNLPPELQEQVKAEMKPEITSKDKLDYEIIETGKKAQLYGFECEEYLLTSDEKMMTIWAAEDKTNLSDQVAKITEKFEKIFPDEEGDDVDEWELMKGKILVEVRNYYPDMTMMGQSGISMSVITKIENTKPPASKFTPPGPEQGFSQTSFSEMMMMQGAGQE